MPFHSHIIIVSFFPHVFSCTDPISKNDYKKKYQRIKKYGSAAALTEVWFTEGTELAKDVIYNHKLKVYGYKLLFTVVSSPVIQFMSLPLYVFSYNSKFRKFVVAVTEVGAKMLG